MNGSHVGISGISAQTYGFARTTVYEKPGRRLGQSDMAVAKKTISLYMALIEELASHFDE